MLKSAEYNEKTISQAIKTKWAGKTVYFAEKVDSTNSWIKRLSKEGAEHGTLAVAEFQSAGRGRFDRKWEAPEGSSVMMTILLRPEFEPQYASMLTLVMGLAVAQAVDELGFKVSIKWPNDVVLSRKKICGILTEMGTNGTKIGYVLIGVGINVNLWEFPEEMQDKATSLAMESGQEYDRNQIIGLVMKHFEEDYERFIQTCDFENLLEEYHRILANLNQPVRVLNGADSFEGVSRGIDTKGELLVEKADGTVTKISAGEVSVRGLYSYVGLRNVLGGNIFMYQDNIVLCGASAYEQKFYFNQDFNALPDHVKKELQIMCVLFTEDVGGILTLEFAQDGTLEFKTEALEADARYDEIGSALKIKQIQTEKKELLESLEMYYRVFFLGDITEDDLKKVPHSED